MITQNEGKMTVEEKVMFLLLFFNVDHLKSLY